LTLVARAPHCTIPGTPVDDSREEPTYLPKCQLFVTSTCGYMLFICRAVESFVFGSLSVMHRPTKTKSGGRVQFLWSMTLTLLLSRMPIAEPRSKSTTRTRAGRTRTVHVFGDSKLWCRAECRMKIPDPSRDPASLFERACGLQGFILHGMFLLTLPVDAARSPLRGLDGRVVHVWGQTYVQ
jgi:hypothetical protein